MAYAYVNHHYNANRYPAKADNGTAVGTASDGSMNSSTPINGSDAHHDGPDMQPSPSPNPG